MNAQDLKAYYAHLTDGELAKIASARGTLVPEAKICLDLEVAKRQLSPEDLKRFRNYRHDYRHEEDPALRRMRRSKFMAKVNDLSNIPRLRWRGVLVTIGCSIILVFVFDHFGVYEFFRPVCGSVVVFFFTVRCHRELKGRPWFLAIVGALAAVHVWIIMSVPWPSRWVPAKVWEGYVTVDLVAVFIIIALMEKLLHEGRFAKAKRPAEG